MSLHFYTPKEENQIEESINKYKNILEKYVYNMPTKEDVLEQMIISSGGSKEKAKKLIDILLKDVKAFINDKFNEIKNKYPKITMDDAIIIGLYTYEFPKDDEAYNIYKILNNKLVSANRK